MPTDSTLERLPTSSPITGKPSPARRQPSSIGPQRGATGAAANTSATPEEIDHMVLASLPPSVASVLRETTKDFIDPVYGFDSEFTGYALAAQVMAPDREVAIARVEAALTPAQPTMVRMELARLRASTKARVQPGDDLTMILQVLAEECQDYPPDVVRYALRQWAKREVFFPALAELRDELQRHCKRRRALLEALRRHG